MTLSDSNRIHIVAYWPLNIGLVRKKFYGINSGISLNEKRKLFKAAFKLVQCK